jgi:hypothetical protein
VHAVVIPDATEVSLNSVLYWASVALVLGWLSGCLRREPLADRPRERDQAVVHQTLIESGGASIAIE